MSNSYLRALFNTGKIVIYSPDAPFDPDFQIEPDALNLRLHPLAMKLKPGEGEIDLLDSDAHIRNYFEPCPIPVDGLRLEPGEPLFGKTLETVEIRSNQHIGFVFGRRTIAGFGLSITCDQPKFPAGLPWNFPLQLRNNTKRTLVIYPYMYIAQLVLIEYPLAAVRSYRGIYRKRIENFFPSMDANEQKRVNDARDDFKDRTPYTINTSQSIEKLMEELEIKERDHRRSPKELFKTLLLSVAESSWQILLAVIASLVILQASTNQPINIWIYIGLIVAAIISYLLKAYINFSQP